MKSTNDKKKAFSMEDFDKGLMLAGFLTANSIEEINERETLKKHEEDLVKEEKKAKSQTYFKRVVLAAEIASQMHSEATFGHVKFQKLIYLCENAADMDLNAKYSKQAAGPFDRKFMHTIDQEFKKQKWFVVEKIIENNYQRYKYTPLENKDGYKSYYASHFGNWDTQIQYILDLFRKQKTDAVEIAATIYACLLELMKEATDTNEENLLSRFYNWSEQKSKYSREQILTVWDWMKEKSIIPVSDNS